MTASLSPLPVYTIRYRIREYRRARHISATQLAAHLGKSRTWLMSAERGEYALSIAHLVQLGAALQVRPWWKLVEIEAAPQAPCERKCHE